MEPIRPPRAQNVPPKPGTARAQKVDLIFPVHGRTIPVDHGYALFSAISRLLESPDNQWLHESDNIGIHLIRGHYIGQGYLALDPQGARLGVRLPADMIPKLLPLAGKQISFGDATLRLGVPQPRALKPAVNLYAHMVTTRNGQEEARFDEEIGKQLAALGVLGKAQRGPRRTFSVKNRKVVAHALLVTELTAEESVRLQEAGLGGRRKLGCGVFVPWQPK